MENLADRQAVDVSTRCPSDRQVVSMVPFRNMAVDVSTRCPSDRQAVDVSTRCPSDRQVVSMVPFRNISSTFYSQSKLMLTHYNYDGGTGRVSHNSALCIGNPN